MTSSSVTARSNQGHEWSDAQFVEKAIMRPDLTVSESQDLYRQWAESGTYDKIMGPSGKTYAALDNLCEALRGLFPDPASVRVLDVGAGTGLTGERLQSLGFTNIDGLEPQPNLAAIASTKGIYRRIVSGFIGGETPLDIPDDTYDVIATTGTFCPGHIPCSAVPEMVRLVKPGGYIVNCMREEFLWTVPEYKDRLVPLLDQLEQQGRWRKIAWKVYQNHFQGKTGVAMVYQVC